MGDAARNSSRTQFRIRDLIVAIFAAALSMAVFVQWIIPAREAARRNACQTKMKALGVGLINYESAFGAFPHAAPSCTTDAWHSTGIENGQICVGPSWSVPIMGFMEEVALAKLWTREISIPSTYSWVEFRGVELGDHVPNFLLCPSSPVASALHESAVTQLDNLAKGNYAVCVGSSTYLHSIENNPLVDSRLSVQYLDRKFRDIVRTRGICTLRMIRGWQNKYDSRASAAMGLWMFAAGQGTKASEVFDGTSKTALLSEVVPFDTNKPISVDIRGVWVGASMGASTFSHLTGPNSETPDNINGCDTAANGPLRCVEVPPGTDQEGDTFAAARSQHLHGVNVVYADGSIKFVTNDVDLKVWRLMATRAGADFETIEQSSP